MGSNWNLNLTMTFLMVWMLSSTWTVVQPIGGNLLQFASQVTTKTPRLAPLRTLLPLIPKNSKKVPQLTSNFESIQIYLDFLADYSVFKRWETLQLLFPKAEKKLCKHFQVFLLKKIGVLATCHDSNTSEFSTGSRNIPRITTWKKEPLVVCHFLTAYSMPTDRINVNPKFFIDYLPIDILTVSSNYENAEFVMDEMQPEINTNYKWTLASRVNDSNKLNIENIYGIVNSAVPIRNPVGYWSSDTGISVDYHKLQGPSDFQGRTLRITTYEGPPVVYVIKSKTQLEGRGYLPDILEHISAELNFTYILSLPADNSFGSKDENGTWSGMVGVLQRREAEMALMSFSYTDKRKEVMDFSPPVEYSSTRLLIRKDWQNNELKWKAYSDPFDWQVWLAIPWIIILGILAFVAFTHYKLMKTTPTESAWFLSACFLQQGLDEHNSVVRFPCRVALGSFWILAVVLYASYTARLTSFLAATTETLPINSLSEAVSNHHWKIGLVKGSSVPDRVKESSVPEMMKMWHRIRSDSSGYVSGFKDGLDRVYQERFVFFTSELIPSFLVKGNCSYTWVPGKYFPGFGYMGYPKDLPFEDIISSQVARIRESGQMKRLFKKWWGADSSCSLPSGGSDFLGMSLYETGTAFLLLMSGGLLALLLMLIEFYIHIKNPFDLHRKIQDKPNSSSSVDSNSSTKSESRIKNDKDEAEAPFYNAPIKSNTSYTSHHLRGLFLSLSTPFKNFQDKVRPEKPFSLKF